MFPPGGVLIQGHENCFDGIGEDCGGITVGEEYARAGIIEVEGFEAEFDGWEYSGAGREVMRGAGCYIIIFGMRC